MLNVSEAVKQAYINGNAKTEIFLTVTTTDGVVHEYNPRNILSGSVSIVESLCSSETFDISRVEKNELSFTLFNITEDISGLQGGNVVAKQRVYTDASDETVYTDIPLGTYTIAEAMNDGDYLYKCTAYEATTVKLDNLIDDWWKNLTFPITLRNLAVSMFQYLGCAYDIPATFTNSDYSIETLNADFEGVTGAEILGYIQEIVGGFFKADRQGVIKLKVPTPVSSGLYPHIGLYPREGLYPRKSNRAFGDDTTAGAGDWDYPQIVGDLQLGDYDVKSVTKVQIRGTEDDIGIIAGSGTNTYVIQGNPLLFNLTAEDGATIAQNILDQVGQIAYKPFSGKFMSQPYVEVGDIAKIETYAGKEGDSPIFQRTLSGARLAFDNFQSLGLEYREQVSSVNRKLTTINQRTHEIKNTVDEMSSTVSNVEQRVTTNETNITQNANAITLQAQKTGYQNYIVNGDFSDLSDPAKGWTLFTSGGICEVVDDPDFKSGKAIHFVQGSSGSAFARYDLNFGEEVELYGKKVVLYIDAKTISTSDPANRMRMRIRGKSTDGTYSVLSDGWVTVQSGVRSCRLIYQPTSSRVVTELQFLPLFAFTNYEGEGYMSMACAIIIDADETAPTWGFFTDLSKNNLISQINIAPSGVTIQGEKIDIKGITTFSSGSSETTVIDGGTVNLTNLNASNITTGTLSGNRISGGIINGIEIDSGDMYWYKGTTNQAQMSAGNQMVSGTRYYGVVVTGNLFSVKASSGAAAFTVNYDGSSTTQVGKVFVSSATSDLTYGNNIISANAYNAGISAPSHVVAVSSSALQIATDGLTGLRSVKWAQVSGTWVLALA